MGNKRIHLLDLNRGQFEAALAEAGEPRYRAAQVFEWIYERSADSFGRMTNLSKDLRASLAERFVIRTSKITREQRAADGTTKLLLGWPDGRTTECVLIPDGLRRTACISSQVGCPVRCTFCASGIGGLERNLTSGEIVEQVLRVRNLCEPDVRLSNVVFMGLGEPLANYSAVLRAVHLLNAPDALNIGARKITISTIGLPPRMRKLADEKLQITLAISLHAPNDELRARLIPWAARIPLAEVVDAARYYFDRTGREITLEYLLLRGVNDRFEHARQLAHLTTKMRCNVNLIRYNPVKDLPFERPESEDAHYFATKLREHGVNVHVRKSRGLDIDAACGQLRRQSALDVASVDAAAETDGKSS